MRELHSMQALDAAVPANADGTSEAGSIPIERDDERVRKAAAEIGIRRVTFMMLDAFQLLQETELAERALELLVPLAMEGRCRPAPFIRAALRDVPRNDTL